MVNVRKLAAIDLLFLGPVFVITEFVLAVVLLLGLGARSLYLWHWPSLWAWYLFGAGVNYIPLLVYAIIFTRRRSASTEIGETARADMRRYRNQSLWLLVPFVVALAALGQERTRRAVGRS